MMCGIDGVTKTMCRGLLILAFTSPSLPARAADCFIGKWKLDPEKSYVDGSYCARLPKVHADLKLKRGSATFRHEGKNGYTFIGMRGRTAIHSTLAVSSMMALL